MEKKNKIRKHHNILPNKLKQFYYTLFLKNWLKEDECGNTKKYISDIYLYFEKFCLTVYTLSCKIKSNATYFDVPEDIPYDSLNLLAIIVGIGAKR